MPDFDEALLSAYLDGELSPGERARVEEWLAEQPENRQLLEELRSIATSLQRLPRGRLPHDFAEQVLRQAEREMLTSPGEQRPPNVSAWQRLRRPIVWAALALAAGLLLMFVDRGRLPPAALRQVAQAPGDAPARPEIGAPAGEAAGEIADENEALQDALPRSGVEHDFPAGPKARPLAAPGEAGSKQAAPANEPLGAAGAARGRAEPSPEGDKKIGLRDRESLNEAPPPKDAADQTPAEGAENMSLATLSDQALLVWCEVSPDTQYNERFRELLTSNSITWSEGPEQESKDRRERMGRLRRSDLGRQPKAPAAAEKSQNKAADGDLKKDEAATPPPPAAARPGSLPNDAQDFAYWAWHGRSRNLRRLAEAGQTALEEDAELVVVEASEPQIKAVLAELDRDEDVFKAVDVEPADDAPRQQQFGQYRRAPAGGELAERKSGLSLKKKVAAKADADAADKSGVDAYGKAEEQSAGETRQASRRGIAYRLRSGTNPAAPGLQVESLDETKRSGSESGEHRLQVLFVLQPRGEAQSAAPPDKKQPDQD